VKHLKIAATADGGLVIEGYGVPFGGPIKGKDLHGQYFSKNTDFALDLIPDGQRPLLFQHGLDAAVDTAVIGRWGVKKIDDGGVWVRAQLDARSEYINEIKELVDNDALGFSSGTMGHLVKVSGKTGEILKWALVELSLTPNPANPNAYIVRANKSAAAHVKSLLANETKTSDNVEAAKPAKAAVAPRRRKAFARKEKKLEGGVRMLKVKRTVKHGDHDQSEHGAWASGGGAGDKETSEREKTGDEKGYNGWTNHATWNMGLMTDGAFEDDAQQALEDSGGDVQEAGRALGHTMLNATEEDFDANGMNSEVANSLISGVVERMDWDAIADGYIEEAGGTSTYSGQDGFRRDGEEEHNGWTNRSTWLGALHIDNSGVMGGSDSIRDIAKEALDAAGGDSEKARYELGRTLASNIQDEIGMIADNDSNGGSSNVFLQDLFGQGTSGINWNEIGEKTVEGFAEPKKSFRVKRSTKHGDHDQADHAPGGAGAGRGKGDKEDEEDEESRGARLTNEAEENRRDNPAWQEKFGNKGVSEEQNSRTESFAEKVNSEDLERFGEDSSATGISLTVNGEETAAVEIHTSEGDYGGQSYYFSESEYSADKGPTDTMVVLTDDETYGMQDSQELKDYLAANFAGQEQDKIDTAYEKLIRKADQNYKDETGEETGNLDLEFLLGK
jgi:hypothetical protein